MAYLVFTLAVGVGLLSPAPSEPVKSDIGVSAEQAKREFEQYRSERHPWKKGIRLPRSHADAGLLSDAAVVWTGLYADGGTRGYLLKDSRGKFLAICTGPGFQSKDHPNRIEAEVGSRMFVGGLHYTDKHAEMVPAKSDVEAWLKSLLPQKEGANKSPEPTPTAVMPRASERNEESEV